MRNMILGTDWWTDCDDAVAIRLLSYFVKNKKNDIVQFVWLVCSNRSSKLLC